MIYTSYFGNVPKLLNSTPYLNPKQTTWAIYSIANSQPDWVKQYHFPVLRELVPTWNLVSNYKAGLIDEHGYKTQYVYELASLPEEKLRKVKELFFRYHNPNLHLILLCWETPDKFCHRQILPEFFPQFQIKEWGSLLPSRLRNVKGK